MSKKATYQIEIGGYTAEEFLENAESQAHKRGYTVKQKKENSMTLQNPRAEYQIEIDEDEKLAELKGKSSGELNVLKSLLESTL